MTFIHRFFASILFTIFLTSSAQAVVFTGNTDMDFPTEACFSDPGGAGTVGMPVAFPVGTLSGWDVDQICLLYNGQTDTLSVGIKTFEQLGTMDYIPFGDADGDGDPGGTSAILAGEAGADIANIGVDEAFAFIVDFDANFATTPNVVAGVSFPRSLPTGYRVREVFLPDLGLVAAFLDGYYGNEIGATAGSGVFASPSPSQPHLEFTIVGFSQLPGFDTLDPNDPDQTVGLAFRAGSGADAGIGDEIIEMFPSAQDFFDDDGDDIPNEFDPDSDNDGISDVTERDLEDVDTNNDCFLSPDEILASGLDTDMDGDIDINDGYISADTDNDGNPDFLDTDADGDTILDIHEADTVNFDDNDDLTITPDEFGDVGCPTNDELPDTDGDDTPDYRDLDTDGDGIPDEDEAGDDDPQTPPVDTDDDDLPDYRDPDSDGDGLPDDEEIDIGTDPLDPDTDDDGLLDGVDQDPLFPGDGLDPDIGVPNSGANVQVQGSGFAGCTLNKGLQSGNHTAVIMLVLMALGVFMMRRKQTVLRAVFFFSILVLMPAQSYALNAEQFKPTFDNLGLFNLYDARTLQKRAWSAGASLSFAQNPVELGLISTGQRLDSLVDYHVGMTLTGAYGINDWITVGLVVPFFPNLKIEPVGTSVGTSSAAFGDIGLAGKFRLWDYTMQSNENIQMAVAVIPYVNFPTGSTSKFTGDKSLTGGVRGAYELNIGVNKVVGNLGLRLRQKETLFNLAIGQELLYGVGFQRPIWQPWDLHVLTEMNGSTTFNGFGSRANRSPLEWLLGARKGFLESRLQATLGAGFGITNGYGSPDYRVFAMVNYQGAPIKKRVRGGSTSTTEKRVTYKSYVRLEGGQIVILEPIHFETARWKILPESQPVVKAVANLMRGQPWIRHVVVEGHTDHRGSDQYNLNLSANRANEVRLALIKHGVEKSRVSSRGMGEQQPIKTNKTVEGMAKNRRVEFHIVEVQKINEKEEVTEKTEKVTKSKRKR